MKRILSIMILLLAVISTNANAWFFFILPSSVTGAIADAVTGSESSNCVGENAKVGDVIRLPGGGQGIIKSLSGTSMRCTQPEFPIRALIDTENTSPKPSNTTKLPFGSNSLSKQEGESCNNKFECVGTLGCESGRCVHTQDGSPVEAPIVENPAAVDAPKLKIGKGSPCSRTIDCDGAMYCMADRCVVLAQTPAGEACSVSAECSGTLVCESGRCIQSQNDSPITPLKAEESPLIAPVTQHSSSAQRLRDLKSLLKEGVITQKDYDTKKQEILKSM